MSIVFFFKHTQSDLSSILSASIGRKNACFLPLMNVSNQKSVHMRKSVLCVEREIPCSRYHHNSFTFYVQKRDSQISPTWWIKFATVSKQVKNQDLKISKPKVSEVMLSTEVYCKKFQIEKYFHFFVRHAYEW